jgi:hypothetical protein
VQTVVVSEVAFWRRWQGEVFNGAMAVETGNSYAGSRWSNESRRSVWRRSWQQQQQLRKGSDGCGQSKPPLPPSSPSLNNRAIVAPATAEEDDADDGEPPGNNNAGQPTVATKKIQAVCCCRASADGTVTWIAMSWEDKTLSLYSATSTSS